jgi:hypothetical protein
MNDDGRGDAGMLPDDLMVLLGGGDLAARVGFTIELLTAGEDGWPHVALLSVGEVLALDRCNLRLALWPGSRTTGNLTRARRAVLAFVYAQAAYRIRLTTQRLPDLSTPALRAAFEGRVVELRADEVPYAVLKTGTTFELIDEPGVLSRWQSTIDALRALPGQQAKTVP